MKIRTVYDAGADRRNEAALSAHRAMKAQHKLDVERRTLGLYPEIGILNRGRAVIFYAYVDGQYTEHKDVDVIARKLGAMRLVAGEGSR